MRAEGEGSNNQCATLTINHFAQANNQRHTNSQIGFHKWIS